MEDGLKCINCDVVVHPDDAKLFAGVFVCPTCFTFSERLFRRSERELKQLLLVLQDTIRIALIEGRLFPEEGTSLEEIPKAKLLNEVALLQEKRDVFRRVGGS